MNTKDPLKFGDLVCVDRYDKTERPPNRIGSPAKVVAIEETWGCESGQMVTISGPSGKTACLDRNWLIKINPK